MNKSILKILGLILSLALVFTLSMITAACGENKDDDKNKDDPPAVHTHTYADTWSNDETNHWHAATCEHTAEVKDKAAHTVDSGACTVCGYAPEPEGKCSCETECVLCPECDGCIDTDCTEADCIKCGDGLVSHEFEAEQSVFTDGLDTQVNCNDRLDSADDPPCVYVQGLMNNIGATLTFTIVANKDAAATLKVRSARARELTIFTTNVSVLVNGEIIERDAYVNPPREGRDRKRDFGWTNLGCVPLTAGENVIQLITPSGNAMGYNMDKIDLMTEAGCELTWTPTDNSDKWQLT